MEQEALRIFIAVDHSLLRSGVIKSLSGSFPDAEFGEAGTAAEALKAIRNGRWDIVILDISLPDSSGLEVLKKIKEHWPALPVIIFSMYPEDQFALRAIRGGASAYLTKDIPSNEFALAIRRILQGERYLTPSLVDLITNEIRDDRRTSSHEYLSDREFQVFLLIASGMSVSVIAEKLGLSVKTISVYRSNILKKMDIKNNAEITHYAFKHKLVE